jgi:hypothetical protein
MGSTNLEEQPRVWGKLPPFVGDFQLAHFAFIPKRPAGVVNGITTHTATAAPASNGINRNTIK